VDKLSEQLLLLKNHNHELRREVRMLEFCGCFNRIAVCTSCVLTHITLSLVYNLPYYAVIVSY